MMRWDSILGQAAAVRFLRRALAASRLPHVLLFWGPKGVGKRLAARTLAAAALCERPEPSDETCGACASCREFAAGVHPDYHEIMHVSRRDGKETVRELTDEDRSVSIAAVRRLVAEMGLTASRGGRKVAVVPGASRIQELSQNALLKTLEEPAGDALWVLTSEDPSLILPTVRSRATPVRFGRVPTGLIAGTLPARNETDVERSRWAARAAEGSVARASELLTEGWEEERRFLVDEILPGVGAGPRAGPALARALRQRVSTSGRKKKRKKGEAAKKGQAAPGGGTRPEGARRAALRLLAALEILLREKMRDALSFRAGPLGRWARALEVTLESDAAIRRNVRVELALAVASVRLARG